MALVLFWGCLALVAYSYAGYPLLLWLWARRARRPAPPPLAPAALPRLSLLIAAHDEEAVIVNKLANCAALDYPADRLEVLIGSDGSRDATNALVRAHGGPNVRLLDFEAWRGKAAVLNDLLAAAQGEIVIFTDANTQLEPPALRRLAAHFADPQVGAVGGHLVLHRAPAAGQTGGADESLYWRYETALKAWEGDLGLLAAAPGALHAQRRALARPVPTQRMVSDDLYLAGMALLQGYTVRYERQAVAHETAAPETRGELRRKIRVAETAYNTLPYLWPLLLPGRTAARVAWMFWSHKLLRWLAPFLLLAAFGANLFLLNQPLYQAALVGQVAFYAAAALGYLIERHRPPPKWLSFPYYFTGANLALLLGCLRSLTRPATPTWSRAAR